LWFVFCFGFSAFVSFLCDSFLLVLSWLGFWWFFCGFGGFGGLGFLVLGFWRF